MNWRFIDLNFYSLLIALLFLSLAILSNIPLPGDPYGGHGGVETGYIEALQVILIVSTLVVGFVRKSYLINVYSRFTYWFRQSLFGLILFEEISYLTKDKFNFLDYNFQSELNFHNSHFLKNSVLEIPFLGDDAISLTPDLIISFFVIVFLFAGAKIPFLKRFSIISLHPSINIGILFYPFAITFSKLIRYLFSWDQSFLIVHIEFLELFVYIIFLMDIVIKSYPLLSANACK